VGLDGISDLDSVRVSTPFNEFPKHLYRIARKPKASQIDHPGVETRIVGDDEEQAFYEQKGWSTEFPVLTPADTEQADETEEVFDRAAVEPRLAAAGEAEGGAPAAPRARKPRK
jgi:hypothetical protein